MTACRLLLVSTVLLPAGCAAGDASPAAVERTDSAGVELIRSPGADRPLGWTLERVLSIDPEGGAAGVFVPSARAVQTDAAGRIYALDHDAARIVVFEEDGRFVRAQGRKGGGPGEANFALALAVAPDGTAAMYDVSKRRLVGFDPEGRALEERAVDGFFGGGIRYAGAGLIHDFRHFDPEAERSSLGLRRVAGGVTEAIVERETPPTRPIQLESCGMGFSGMEPVFTPSLRWDARGDTLVVVEDAGYDVRWFVDGGEIRRLRRDVAPRPATAALAAQELGEGMQVRTEGGVRTCRTDEVVEKRGFAPAIPAVASVVLAPGGELWVKRGGIEGEEKPVDVFGADGAYLGSLPRGTPLPAAFLGDGRFVTVETDELDVARLVVYRVRR